MIKIVVDTNLLVAGRWNKKSSSLKIIELCLEGVVQPVYSAQTKDENLYILGKVKAPSPYLDKIIKFYQTGLRVKPNRKIHAIKEDASDNQYLEAAVEGKADYIISSDHHLLDLKQYQGIPLLKPSQFMAKIKAMTP